MAASCLEAMAGSEQLRTRESWVPEANAVIREFMRSLDVYAEDLIYAPDGYNTKIDRIDDALDMSTSLFIVNKLAVEHCQQLGNKMSLIVMSSEYLTGSTEEQARYIAECEQYDNQSEYGGDAWLADEQAMAATIQLEAREDSSLKSTVQVQREAVQCERECIVRVVSRESKVAVREGVVRESALRLKAVCVCVVSIRSIDVVRLKAVRVCSEHESKVSLRNERMQCVCNKCRAQ